MKNHKLATHFKLITIALCLYAFALVYLYMIQGNLVFRPSSDNPFLMAHEPFHPFTYNTAMGLTERGMWYPPAQDKPVIVHFHGNGGSIANRFGRGRTFLKKGYGIALVEYRGYGGNPGSPSEANLMEDARSAIKALHDLGVPYDDMVLYGESLGTGVAVQMALEFPQAKALVLESPYTSITEIAAEQYWYFPVRDLVRDKFESDKRIGQVKMPVLIMHGTKDSLIPLTIGQKLYALVTSRKKQFAAIQGGEHNNLYDFKADEVVDAFLRSLN